VRLTTEDSTVSAVLPSSTGDLLLEVEAELSRQRTRRHVMRSAEGREEIIQRQSVGNVDGGKPRRDTVGSTRLHCAGALVDRNLRFISSHR
jgi:hypothetical protein